LSFALYPKGELFYPLQQIQTNWERNYDKPHPQHVLYDEEKSTKAEHVQFHLGLQLHPKDKCFYHKKQKEDVQFTSYSMRAHTLPLSDLPALDLVYEHHLLALLDVSCNQKEEHCH